MSDTDQNFFDVFMLVLGILIGVAFALLLLARYVASGTQEQWVIEDQAYQKGIAERIEPVGRVVLTGDADASAVQVAAAEPVREILSGPQVYNSACLACHGNDLTGAPMFGNAAQWAPRIAKGKDVLVQHTIEGFTGEVGYMPPKGGRVDLSDDEILAALDYMIEEAR